MEDSKLKSLVLTYKQCLRSIAVLHSQDMPVPALILIYTTIDSLGNLAAETSDSPVRENFCIWTENWILGELETDCRAIDLYAARCGLLHSTTFESSLQKSGKARPIAYIIGGAQPEPLERIVAKRPDLDFLVLSIDDLAQALRNGAVKFFDYAAGDQSLVKQMLERAPAFFAHCNEGFGRIK